MPPKLARVSDIRLPEKVKKDFKKLCESFELAPDSVAASVERVREHVNKPIIDGKTPLYSAVEAAAQDLALVQALLQVKDVQVDAASDPDGDTPLLCALKSGRDDVAEILLRAGANPCKCNDNGVSALRFAAAEADRATVFESVLQAANGDGAKVKTDSGTAETTLLHLAAAEACTHQLQLLLQVHPDLVSAPDDVGRTPLHSAAETGAVHCVKTLIKASASIDAADCEGNTAMHLALAAEEMSEGVITALKAAGCNMSAKNTLGLTCSEVADIRKELAADMAARASQVKDDVRERKEKRREEKLADLRDFLETEAELDAASIEALIVAGHVGSIDALVKLCDSSERLSKIIKAPKVVKRIQAAVRRYLKGFSSEEDSADPSAPAKKSNSIGRSIAYTILVGMLLFSALIQSGWFGKI